MCRGIPNRLDNLGCGVAFYGESGTLLLGSGNGYILNDIKGRRIKEVKSDLKFEEGNLLNPSEALDMFHFRNWFAGMKRGEKLNSNIVDACISTQLVQYGNIAQRTGKQLEIDPTSGRILNADGHINKLWGRKYQKGWEPKI